MQILELIYRATEYIGKFIDDLIDAWRQGKRRRVLLVVFVVLCIVCASQQEWLRSSISWLENFPQVVKKPWVYILWILPIILFIWVIYESIKPPPPTPSKATEFKETVAIKGLRSFTEEDQEIFKQLERNRVLQNCLAEITRNNFRFGFLYGESGCGKSSFIKAGIIPQLSQADSKIQGIYVCFSERDPFVSIRQAFVKKLPLFPEDISQLDFVSLLSQGVEAASKPLVLIFDQFEQFFVHFKRKEDRQFFIQALATWYKHPHPPQVKILFSIRQDFYAYLVELQNAFAYSPSPQEIIELEKFSPEEATNIIEVIARTTEGLEIDRQFTQKVAEQELASGEDCLISPVDLQLLAWIINGQKASELRGFTEKAFQKLGGIEGLLSKFLERTLQARITEKQRQATIKVLLGLTDAERRVRVGILTFEELQKKLPDLSINILQETINWLKVDGVRLITPVEREGIIGYELAHEKIIPALLKLSDHELPEVDKANQLLERRVNEWLSNDCEPYYLLRWRELKSINKQKLYLKWGTNRQHKERLIAKSKRRFQTLFHKAIGLLIVFGLLWLGTGYYFATPQGEIQQIRWELNRVSKQIDNDEAAVSIAIAVAKGGDFKRSLDIIANQIDDSSDKVSALSSIALVYDQLNQPQKGRKLLELALSSSDTISISSDEARALGLIASAISQFNQPQKGVKLLELALSSVNQTDDSSDKVNALSSIALVYDQLNQPQKGRKLLELALSSVNQIDNANGNSSKAWALSSIASAISQLNQPQKGMELLESVLSFANKIDGTTYKATALSSIAVAYGQLNQPQKGMRLLESVLSSSDKIYNFYGNGWALSSIASAISQLNQPQEGMRLLELALFSADKFDNLYYKAKALSSIAVAYGQFNQPQKGRKLLELALSSVNQIDNANGNSSKAKALSSIAVAYGRLNQPQEGMKLLESAFSSVNQTDNSFNKSRELQSIITAIYELNQPQEGMKLLELALSSANQIDYSSEKSSVLSSIADIYAKYENWGEARKTSEKITIQDNKAMTLARVFTTWLETQNPKLAEKD